MDGDDCLPRMLGGFKAFVAHLQASLILVLRMIGAAAFNAGGVEWKCVLSFDVAMNNRHNNPQKGEGHASIQKASENLIERKGFRREAKKFCE